MSTHPVVKYVSYLTTDALVHSLGKVTEALMHRPNNLTRREVEVLRGVREDLLDELRERQETIPGMLRAEKADGPLTED